ncbi:hypothetical protein [endosymbiont 'TC1' of Trimyema compressum]|uniref:hypothetical protein n=1 Tax=endosymbiont 'TC1' of Trimyema compressum TaxID=243899 RepID=UPI00139223C5|nr:hypothetical protein [endosymbiont 'TC1' of Trimyema compressum]
MSIKRKLIIATTALFAVGGLTGTVFGATNFSSRARYAIPIKWSDSREYYSTKTAR